RGIVGTSSQACTLAGIQAGWIFRAKGKQTALQIVIEAVDGSAAIFASELDRMFSAHPGEVIENLVSLTAAAARNAECRSSEIIEDTAEVDFRQSQFAGAKVESRRGVIIVCVERTERSAIAAIAETNFVDAIGTDRGKQAGGDQLHARGRGLGELRQAGTRSEPQASERKRLLRASKGVPNRKRF